MYILQKGLNNYYVKIDSISNNIIVSNSSLLGMMYFKYYIVLFIKIKLLVIYKTMFKIIRL